MSLPQNKILASLGTANRTARTAETHPLTWRLRDKGLSHTSASTP